jgi:hypothetical protein
MVCPGRVTAAANTASTEGTARAGSAMLTGEIATAAVAAATVAVTAADMLPATAVVLVAGAAVAAGIKWPWVKPPPDRMHHHCAFNFSFCAFLFFFLKKKQLIDSSDFVISENSRYISFVFAPIFIGTNFCRFQWMDV